MFELHPQLKKDLLPLGELKLSLVFLLPDSDNPWVVLVPKVKDIKEWHQLPMADQQELLKEINLVSNIFEQQFKPDKINIGALGNMVPQLHVHIICRYKNDKAWPGAIWGYAKGQDLALIEKRLQILSQALLA